MTHVLVVDDEPAIVEIVRDYLVDAGFRVSSARSGEEALRLVRSVVPDLIVLDLGLPGVDGLDGRPHDPPDARPSRSSC